MNKQVIKITESELKRIVNESVKKILNETVLNDNDKLIDILYSLINQNEVIINVNSEKTAKTWLNKLSKLMFQLKSPFYPYRYDEDASRALADNNLINKLSNICSNPKLLIEIYIKLQLDGDCRKNFIDNGIEQTAYFSYWDLYSGETKTITWVASNTTQTSKRNVKKEIAEVIDTIKEKLGVSQYYEVKPPFIQMANVNYGTEKFLLKQLEELNKMLNGEWLMKRLEPCSDKQAYHIQRILNIPMEKAKILNKTQAAEFLSTAFDGYPDQMTDEIYNFYKTKLK